MAKLITNWNIFHFPTFLYKRALRQICKFILLKFNYLPQLVVMLGQPHVLLLTTSSPCFITHTDFLALVSLGEKTEEIVLVLFSCLP
jgi:hypothetical protein